MVGVAGKFKGCNTCRDRRVKCDNTRPACKKCINSGRECGGYVRERIFIVGTAKERGRCSSHPHRSQLSSKSKEKAATAAMAALEAASSSSSQTPRPQSSSAPTPTASTKIDVWGDGSMFDDDPFNTLRCVALHTNFPESDMTFSEDSNDGRIPPLVHHMPNMTATSPALDFSLKALTLIQMGASQEDPNLIKQSREVNTMALAEMRKALMNPKTASRPGTLAASICLFLYEQKACTGDDLSAWKNLLGGSTSLVKQRGPAAFKAFPDHHMFVRLYRNTAIFDAMARRKSTYLADQEWCTVPWEDIPKTPMDNLFDILVQLPNLFERADRLLRYPPSVPRSLKAQDLMKNCLYVESQLVQWFQNLHDSSSGQIFWSVTKGPELDPTNFNNYDPEIREVYEFSSTSTALMHMYYWSSLILFYRVIQDIKSAMPAPTSASGSVSAAPAVTPMFFTGQMGYQNLSIPTYQTPTSTTHYTASTPQSSPFSSPGSQRSYLSQSSPFTSPEAVFTQSPTFNTQTTYAPQMINFVTQPQMISYAAVQPPYNLQQPSYDPQHPAMFALQPSFAAAISQPAESTLDPRFQDSSIAIYATNICRSMDYVLRETVTSIGPDCCAFPLWTALQFHRQYYYSSPELLWCEKLLEKLRRAGSTFAQEMAKVQWQRYE